MHLLLGVHLLLVLLVTETAALKGKPFSSLDIDDSYYFLPKKSGPPLAVIEDLKRGQEAVLVKLKQLDKAAEEDALKFNNIFYKLGNHDTEFKNMGNKLDHSASGVRRLESKLTKHSFNVESLYKQVNELEKRSDTEEAAREKLVSLQNTVNSLEDKLSEVMYRLRVVENSSHSQGMSASDSPFNSVHYASSPAMLNVVPLNDEGVCRSGWTSIGNGCFRVNEYEKTFPEAMAACALMGANLASLPTGTAVESIQSLLLRPGKHYWVSGSDIFTPDKWRYLFSGRAVEQSEWSSAAHDLFRTRRGLHCAVLSFKGVEPTRCAYKRPFVCEKVLH